MKNQEHNGMLVRKPWGEEWLVYSNEKLAIWLLKIDFDKQTSLHAHPHKDSGLIVLDGLAKVSFLNNSITLKGIDKIMIFRGRFHQTKALSKRGAILLEIETPEDKNDLIRLSDNYGRENKGYETEENYFPLTKNHLVIPSNITNENYNLFGCKIKIYQTKTKKDLINKDFESIFVFLDGGIVTEKGDFLSRTGDVVSSHNLDLLLNKFDIYPNTLVMEIEK